MSRRPSLASLIGALALGVMLTGCVAPPGTPHYVPESGASERRADDLTVLTYNIRFFETPGRAWEDWTARRDNIVDLIRRQEADIVGLQEVYNRIAVDLIPSVQLTYLREKLPEYEVTAAELIGHLSAQPILFDPSQFRLIDSGFLSFTEPAGPDDRQRWRPEMPRFASWVLLGVMDASGRGGSGARLWVANVHFDNLSGVSRRASARILADFLVDALAPDDAALIMGDFNTFSRTAPMRTLIEAGFTHALPRSRTGSYHAFSGITFWPRVDHILINRSLESLGGGLIYDRYDEGYPSDHFPAVVYLRWR